MITLSRIKCCIIMATYNNEKTLERVLKGVLKFSEGQDVFVVNDGSTDTTSQILEGYRDSIIILCNPVNSGKGYSLRKAFAAAIAKGFENAITIDSDGQHFPDDIALLLERAMAHPGALLMGSRNMEQEGVPAKSSFGNRFSNFWFYVETGKKLPDTQTGFRLYPLTQIKHIKLFTHRFETEIEVIVKLAWRNVEIIPVNIRVLYDIDERVSHFRPFKDFTRISILNTYFVVLALFYHWPKRAINYVRGKGLVVIVKEELFRTDESVMRKSSSVAFGIFMGIVPIWGFQLLVGIPLAVLLRLNKVLFLAGANVSLPPLIPFIIYLSYIIGGYFVANDVKFENAKTVSLENIHDNFVQYFTGGCVLALACSSAAFVISFILFQAKRKKFTASK